MALDLWTSLLIQIRKVHLPCNRMICHCPWSCRCSESFNPHCPCFDFFEARCWCCYIRAISGSSCSCASGLCHSLSGLILVMKWMCQTRKRFLIPGKCKRRFGPDAKRPQVLVKSFLFVRMTVSDDRLCNVSQWKKDRSLMIIGWIRDVTTSPGQLLNEWMASYLNAKIDKLVPWLCLGCLGFLAWNLGKV